MTATPSRRGDGGFTTIQYVIAVAWSLVLLVLIANLLVDLYERGAVRARSTTASARNRRPARPWVAREAARERL